MIQVKNQKEISKLSKKNQISLIRVTTFLIGEVKRNQSIQNNITDISVIQQFLNLRVLHILGCQITNLEYTEGLQNLKVIKIQSCSLLSDLDSLRYNSGLEELYIDSLQVRTINVISNFLQLNKLQINCCFCIKDFSIIKNCTNLKCVQIGGTMIKDLSSLMQLDQLQQLYLSKNDFLPDNYKQFLFLQGRDKVEQFILNYTLDYKIQQQLTDKQQKLGVNQQTNILSNRKYAPVNTVIDQTKILIDQEVSINSDSNLLISLCNTHIPVKNEVSNNQLNDNFEINSLVQQIKLNQSEIDQINYQYENQQQKSLAKIDDQNYNDLSYGDVPSIQQKSIQLAQQNIQLLERIKQLESEVSTLKVNKPVNKHTELDNPSNSLQILLETVLKLMQIIQKQEQENKQFQEQQTTQNQIITNQLQTLIQKLNIDKND